jgi:hypothetical protein
MYFKIENDQIVGSEYENPGEEGWIYKNFDDSVPLLVVDGDVIVDEDSMPPRPTQQELDGFKVMNLRKERNRILAETDWMANSDVTMSDEWQTYRQALRDITDTYTSRDDVVWPTKPE